MINVVEKHTHRLIELDAIRGIAAIIVVFNHYIQIVPESIRQFKNISGGLLNFESWLTPWFWLRLTPLRIFVNGHAAVVIFFLLSGLVLALLVTPEKQPKFLPFTIKRICRIYIPFLIIITIIYLTYHYLPLQANPAASLWFNSNILNTDDVSVMNHALMTGVDMRLNPVMWSLIHEIRLSFIILLIFWFMRKYGVIKPTTIILIFSIMASFEMTDSANGSWQASIHFAWLFALGAAISFRRDLIQSHVHKLSKAQYISLWVIAITLLLTPFDRVWSDFFIGIGGALLIILCLREGRIKRWLNHFTLQWLGKISYSLYLIHWPILFIATSYHFPLIPAFILTLLIAEMTHRLIESPSQKIGAHLGNTIK